MRKTRYYLRILCVCSLLVVSLPKSTPAVMIELLNTGEPTSPTFNTNPLPPNPDLPGLDFSDVDLNTQYNTIFGTASPNKLPKLVWGENQTTVVMVLTSDGGVDVFQNFNFLATGDYWGVRTDLTLNPSTAIIFDPNDEITMNGFAQHFGKLSADGIPHPGDNASGPMINYDMLINAGNKKAVQNPFGFTSFAVADTFAAAGAHPRVAHEDIVLGALAANVRPDTNAQISFFDEIDGFWIGGVSGNHVVPEPSTAILLGSGMAGVFLRRRKNSIGGWKSWGGKHSAVKEI